MLLNLNLRWLQKAALFHQTTIVFHNKAGSIFKWHHIVEGIVTMTETQVSCFRLYMKSKGGVKMNCRPNQRKISLSSSYCAFFEVPNSPCSSHEEATANFQQLQPGLTVQSCSFVKSIPETKTKQARNLLHNLHK